VGRPRLKWKLIEKYNTHKYNRKNVEINVGRKGPLETQKWMERPGC
jgi:hypothetical protein